MNDARAFRKLLRLMDWIKSIPNSFFVLGDNAHELCNELLILFSGAQKAQPENNIYNFFLSQLKIRIEIAFDRLTTKWRIFRSNLLSENST